MDETNEQIDLEEAMDLINAACEQGDANEVKRLYALVQERDDVVAPPIPEWLFEQWKKQGGAA